MLILESFLYFKRNGKFTFN